jgi:hypothetical protein
MLTPFPRNAWRPTTTLIRRSRMGLGAAIAKVDYSSHGDRGKLRPGDSGIDPLPLASPIARRFRNVH